jgi:maltose alpha-D-glucosyltransferase/alpha-amylase
LTNELQDLLGSRTADQASLIGLRTAEMHLLLSKGPDKDFKPEEYSLHYQRSVFSSMQALVRESIQTFEKSFHNLNEETKREAQFLTDNRNSILNVSRKI